VGRLIKMARALSPRPNLTDYAAECSRFKWTDAWTLLDGLPDGRGYNIAHEAVDRHARGARAGKTAIRWLGKAGERRELTYSDLAAATNRFANALTGLGVQPGERVFVLMGRTPELYVAVLGALKARFDAPKVAGVRRPVDLERLLADVNNGMRIWTPMQPTAS
jgi:acetyl-CoA synthetase